MMYYVQCEIARHEDGTFSTILTFYDLATRADAEQLGDLLHDVLSKELSLSTEQLNKRSKRYDA